MNERREYGSNFVSAPGAALIFVLFVAACGFHVSGLAVFLFIVFVFVLVSFIWSRRALTNMTAEVNGESCRIFPDSDIHFAVTVTNRKWLPLVWLDLSFPDPEDHFLPSYKTTLNWIMPFQEVTLPIKWHAEKRGVYLLDKVYASSGDGFGFSVDQKCIIPDKSLLFVVYPAVIPVNADLLPRQNLQMNSGIRGITEDVTLLKTTREYMPGDPAKRINMRTLAGQGSMDINIYEEILPRQITIMLDLESFSRFETEEENGRTVYKTTELFISELEEMISLIASLILVLAERKEHIKLVIPGGKDRNERTIIPSDPEDTVTELLTALAGLKYSGGPAVFHEWERQASVFSGDLFLFCHDTESPFLRKLLEMFPAHRICAVTSDPGTGGFPCRIIGRGDMIVRD